MKEEKTKNFSLVPDALIRAIGPFRAVICAKIYRYSKMDDGVCNASTERLAYELGIDRKTIGKHLKFLVREGYLVDHSIGIRNIPHDYSVTKKYLEVSNSSLPNFSEVRKSSPPIEVSKFSPPKEESKEVGKSETSGGENSDIGGEISDVRWGNLPHEDRYKDSIKIDIKDSTDEQNKILESNVGVSIYPEGESIAAAPADITLQPVEDLNPIEGVREEIHRYKSNLSADTELQRLFLKDLFWSDSPDNKFSSLESKGAFARLEEQYPDKLRETIEQGGLSALGSEDSKIIRSINNLILDEIYKEESKGERRDE